MATPLHSSSLALEPILGTDKDNPVFSVYRNTSENKIYLYYGLELLEVIPDQNDHPQLKLMVAKLYNAKVKGITLTEVFGFDRKTIKSWADALVSGDPERLIRVLEGRSAGRKLTTEIKAFARFRFESIYPDDKATYSKRVREEIAQVFDVSISSEALRPLFNEIKAEMQTGQETQSHRQTERDSGVAQVASPTPISPSVPALGSGIETPETQKKRN